MQRPTMDSKRYDLLTDRLADAERAGQWRRAIALTEELIAKHRKEDYVDVASRQADRGEYYLNLLEFDAATRIFRRLIDGRQDQYGSAALGLARIAVERGDFVGALEWLKGYEGAWGSGCGNCNESRDQFAHLFRTVWGYGRLEPDQAATRLRDVMAGRFQPLPGNLTRGAHYWEPAAREAKLALAGIWRRAGKRIEARRVYAELRSGDDTPAILARAWLSRMPVRPSPPGIVVGVR